MLYCTQRSHQGNQGEEGAQGLGGIAATLVMLFIQLQPVCADNSLSTRYNAELEILFSEIPCSGYISQVNLFANGWYFSTV